MHRRPVPVPIALLVYLSVVCRVVYSGSTLQDRPVVCIEVEYECGVVISIGIIFDPLKYSLSPKRGVGGSNWGP